MRIIYSAQSQPRLTRFIRPTAVRRRHPPIGRKFKRAITTFFTHLCALFFAGIAGVIAATVSAYLLVYCLVLPVSLAGGLLGSIGAATEVVGWFSLLTFSLLTGLTFGTEIYLGVVQDQGPDRTPRWLCVPWAAAAGALVGALPCALGVDWLLLGPAHAMGVALDSAAAAAAATHLVSLGAVTGAITGVTMERFRIWRRPGCARTALSSEITRSTPREADAAPVRADPQPVLPVDQEPVESLA